MIRYIRHATEALTPALAAEFATMPAHKGERPLVPEHVAWLTTKIETGLFHPPRWAKAWLNGKQYRVNGQHSSTALTEANGHFPSALSVIIDEYSCDSDEDVATLFAQFDPKRSARTDGEIIMATARQFDELNDMKPTPIRIAVNGMVSALQLQGKYTGRANAEVRRALVGDNIAFIRWASKYAGTNRLRSTGSFAAIAVTYQRSPADADKFWDLVRDESHPDAKNPTRMLGRFLSLLHSGREFNRSKGKPWTARAVFVKAIHSWNAYRRGVTTDMSYFEESPVPEVK